jgi:hypothetical protein
MKARKSLMMLKSKDSQLKIETELSTAKVSALKKSVDNDEILCQKFVQ